jgi:hypothetical protein
MKTRYNGRKVTGVVLKIGDILCKYDPAGCSSPCPDEYDSEAKMISDKLNAKPVSSLTTDFMTNVVIKVFEYQFEGSEDIDKCKQAAVEIGAIYGL